MDKILLSLEEHKKMLNSLGYEIDVPTDKISEYNFVYIYYKDKNVGTLSLEEKNMFYLHKYDQFVGNRDLSTINFSKRKQKNMRTLVHTKIFHGNLRINAFNMLHSEDRDFISLSDRKNIVISKYLNNEQVEIVNLLDSTLDDVILDKLRNPKPKSLSYKLGDVIKNEYKN